MYTAKISINLNKNKYYFALLAWAMKKEAGPRGSASFIILVRTTAYA